jgi:hypothetical protein
MYGGPSLIDILVATGHSGAAFVLDPDRLMRKAEAAVGSRDWGDIPFHNALETLCRSAADEARLQGPVLDGFAGKIWDC